MTVKHISMGPSLIGIVLSNKFYSMNTTLSSLLLADPVHVDNIINEQKMVVQ
jgi:hypothetical protein